VYIHPNAHNCIYLGVMEIDETGAGLAAESGADPMRQHFLEFMKHEDGQLAPDVVPSFIRCEGARRRDGTCMLNPHAVSSWAFGPCNAGC